MFSALALLLLMVIVFIEVFMSVKTGKAWGFTYKRPLRYGRFFELSNALMEKSLTPKFPKEKYASTPSVACLAVF